MKARDVAGVLTDLAGVLTCPAPADWRDRAACGRPDTDPEAFFPDPTGDTSPATAACAGCPVQTACLRDAIIGRHRDGVWGGLTEDDRRVMHAIYEEVNRRPHGNAARRECGRQHDLSDPRDVRVRSDGARICRRCERECRRAARSRAGAAR